MSKEKALKSKSFCSALWTSVYQSPDGMVSPCCVFKTPIGNVNDDSLKDIFSSPYIKKLRKKMLDGEHISQCEWCNSIEETTGDESSRTFFNKNFTDYIDWESDESKLYHWDLRLSNLCTFKCRMCSHGLSSEWYDDWKKINKGYNEPRILKIDDKSKFYEELEQNYKYVKSIYFAGGEPFINEYHFKILQDLIDKGLSKEVALYVNTNLSTIHYKKRHILEYYKEFEKVEFGFSIDGSYKLGEYIRKGLDYKKWKENVKQFADYVKENNSKKNKKYLFQFAYGITNYENIFDFINDLIDSNLVNEYCTFNFQAIQYPEEQSIKALPVEIREKYKNNLNEFLLSIKPKINYDVFYNLKHQLNLIELHSKNEIFDERLLKLFYKKQKSLDEIRGENIFEIISDYRIYITNDNVSKIDTPNNEKLI